LPYVDRLLEQRSRFTTTGFFDSIQTPLPDGGHPGSWVLAGRLLNGFEPGRLGVECDINDIDPLAITTARRHHEGGWVRFWNNDWFLFLRSRLAMSRRPNFVFIDPPPDDARGPAYAIDAAILLETFSVPYMVSYPLNAPQEPIDQIGRSGLELSCDESGCGVLLGGGAESALLDLLADLRRLAQVLDGEFSVRLPKTVDYTI
jgi:hypothetical protein